MGCIHFRHESTQDDGSMSKKASASWTVSKALTAEMAIRIARTIGGTPESWLRMQQALDLWTAEAKFKNNPSLAPKALAA